MWVSRETLETSYTATFHLLPQKCSARNSFRHPERWQCLPLSVCLLTLINFSLVLQLIFTWQMPWTRGYLSVHLVLAAIRRHELNYQVPRGLSLTGLQTKWQRHPLSDFHDWESHVSIYLRGCSDGPAGPVCLPRAPVAASAQWTSSRGGWCVYFFRSHYRTVRHSPMSMLSRPLLTK